MKAKINFSRKIITMMMILVILLSFTFNSCQKEEEVSVTTNEETTQLKSGDALIIQLETLVKKIEDYAGYEFNDGIANSLIVKIENSIIKLKDDDEKTAIKLLEAFINQVEDLIVEGTIWGHIGNELIYDAQSVISQNACGLIIGQDYMGGKLAYIMQPGDWRYEEGVCHGIIAMPDDLNDAPWGCAGVSTHDAWWNPIGDGERNTIAHAENCYEEGSAARLCYDLEFNGFNDWWLPSPQDLIQLYLNKNAIGGFADAIYWSSSEFELVNAWYVNFGTGYNGWDTKEKVYKVRAIRYF